MATDTLDTTFAVRLGIDDVEAALLGGKGSTLARLIDIAMPVPATAVVTTEAYRRVAAANPAAGELVRRITTGESVPEAEVDQVFANVTVPDEIESAIVSAAARVGDGRPVAVRSSATVEDLSGSSFAGQYRSLLDIPSHDGAALMAAVRRVWASLWYPAPSAYRRAFGIDESDVAMAVVIMAMIPATTAGVIFTADPGGEDGARVEAVEGLGESLVSGARTPTAWVVPNSTPATLALPHAARRALDLALDIEDRFAAPQDIEWAAVEDDVYIVQARPITVLESHDGFDSPIDDHELTSAGIAELVPGVQPALRWELNACLLEEAFRSVLDALGAIRGTESEDRAFIRRVRGRVAVDFDQLRDATRGIPGAVAELELQYFGSTENPVEDDAGGLGRLQRLRRDLRTARTRRAVIDHAEVLIAATEELGGRRPELSGFDDGELLAYHARVLDLAARGLIGELGVAAAGGASYERLVQLLDRHLGEGEGAAAAQAVTAAAGTIATHSNDASAAVFAGPSWAELETTTTPQPGGEPDGYVTPLRELEARLRSMPGWRRRRIVTGQFVDVRVHVVRRTVHDVVDQLRRREGAKAAFLELGGEIRRVHFEIGRRLVSTGLLNLPLDVELLSTGEMVAALKTASAPPPDALRRRRNWLRRYEVEGQLPIRFRGVPEREPTPLPAGDILHGWAASPGRAHGVARVVTHAQGYFEPGEVLVAEATDASWSPLFVKAGAVVVERGGPLSHAAILARELGLPAVLNVEGATRVLDRCTVSVDGDQGVVVIESRGGDR